MAHFARLAPGKITGFVSLARPHSFFSFREKYFPGLEPLGRLFSQIRAHGARTLVIEEVDESSAVDLREEKEDLATRVSGFNNSSAYRLSFFSKNFKSIRGLNKASSSDFVGYLIIKEDRFPGGVIQRRIFESVLRTSDLVHNYIRGSRNWQTQVGGRRFSVPGLLYAQQNGITNICAHVALRSVIPRFNKGNDMTYREMNRILGIDHITNWVGPKELNNPHTDERGLSIDQMELILDSAGSRVIRADYAQSSAPKVPYQRYVYGSIESGFPSIIVFDTNQTGSKHAIPVFGHTFNRDTWVPSAERGYFQVGSHTGYLPSESWVSSFVMHDDNFGSNFCVPRHYLRPVGSGGSSSNSTIAQQAASSEWVAHVLCPLPKSIKLPPLHAELIGVDFLFAILPQLPQDGNKWGGRLSSIYAATQMRF